MTDAVIKTSFQVWDAVTHAGIRYEHGPGGLVICPIEVAAPLSFL
jgi:hypothetical protein